MIGNPLEASKLDSKDHLREICAAGIRDGQAGITEA